MKSNKKSSKTERVFYQLKVESEQAKRGPVSFSLNLKLYEQFKKVCDDKGQPASRVVEKLMEEFIGEMK